MKVYVIAFFIPFKAVLKHQITDELEIVLASLIILASTLAFDFASTELNIFFLSFSFRMLKNSSTGANCGVYGGRNQIPSNASFNFLNGSVGLVKAHIV